MDDFLNRVVKKEGAKRKARNLTIRHDSWDFSDWDKIIGEMKELSVADDRLCKTVDTGHEAMADAFFALYKAAPMQYGVNEIRPSHLVNHRVIGEAMDLKEYQELRTYSSLDLVAAGMAATAMEPELEVLFDKLHDESEQAQKLEQMMRQLEGMQGEGESIEDMLRQAEEEGDEEGARNYQEQQALINQAMEQLKQQIDNGVQDLNDALDGKADMMGQALRSGMQAAKDEAEGISGLSNNWGLEPGHIRKMSANKRIELAKRINTPKFKKMAELIGPMQRMAMAEQTKKLDFAKDEIYDLELGSDIPHVLPEEMLYFVEDSTEAIFMQKLVEDNLIQFKLQGTEKIAKGGIIFCEDGSGSMSGSKEVWAKAVGLALLTVAKSQNRDFFGVHFCGPGVYKNFNFESKDGRVRTEDYQGRQEEFDQLNGMLDYAETFMGGGTCFVTPLNQAIAKLEGQFNADGKIKGDIVFCTDGQAGVPDSFLKELKEAKEKLGFRIFGINLDGRVEDEPLYGICDGRVFTIKDLITGGDIRTIFRDV